MREFKTVLIPETTKRALDRVVCDICNNEIKSTSFNQDKTEVERTVSKGDQCGGSGECVSFDICGSCFESKLIPWMASQGASPLRTEFDW